MQKILTILSILFLLGNFGLQSFAQYDDTIVILHTNLGKIVIELFPNDAPNHVKNFVKLAEDGFYDGTLFHRIIKDFMIQGGDPKTKPESGASESEWGTGGPETLLEAEFNTIKHNRGIVSMARAADPNSAGSQFFIVHKDSNFLDGQYTVFGRIATQESFDTLDRIASVETVTNDRPKNPEEVRIIKAEVVKRSQIPDLLDLGDPERTDSSVEFNENQEYENKELGIRFSAPAGWLLQEPPNPEKGSPNIIAVGPKAGITPPIISLTTSEHDGETIDDYIAKQSEALQSAVDSGALKILSQKKQSINGQEAFVTEAIGHYENNGVPFDVQFAQVAFITSDKYYVFAYSNDKNFFDGQKQAFESTVNSFQITSPSEETTQIPTETNNEGGGCLIATASYGSELAPQIQQLREIRDVIFLQTSTGSSFMSGFNTFYYSFSPTIADWERQNPIFKEFVKLSITPMVSSLLILNHVEIQSEADVLGYGVSLILLNLGMYVGIPAVIIYRLRR